MGIPRLRLCYSRVPARDPLSARQDEVHLDLGFHFHGLAIENIGPVAPLAHGIERRRDQQGMAAQGLKILDRAVAADYRPQDYQPLNAYLPRQRGYSGWTR